MSAHLEVAAFHAQARQRSARRKESGGAVIFIVAMTLAVLASLGMYALASATNEVKTAGYERQSAQSHYLSEYGILGAAGLPPVTRSIPPGLAFAAGGMMELVHAAFRLPGEPRMTRFLARQLSTAHWFRIDAARRDLGYEPKVSIEEGLRRLAGWFAAAGSPRSARLASLR